MMTRARAAGRIQSRNQRARDAGSVAFDLEVSGFGPDSYGGTRVGFSAISHINRMDFGVAFNGPIPGVPGGVAVSENVTINLEIEGVLQA